MKNIAKIFAVVIMLVMSCFATTVTLQVTDADSQAWLNGTYAVSVVINSSLSPVASGVLDDTGGATVTLTPNTIAGSFYRFTVCAAATVDCYVADAAVTGSTQTTTFTPPAIRIDGRPTSSIKAYTDSEITNPYVGKRYFNTTSSTDRQWNGTAWVAVANSTSASSTYNHSGLQQASTHIVKDRCTLGTDCSVTLTGSAVYTGSTTYDCIGVDRTAAAAVKFVPSSGTAFALTGTGTDTISYVCVGN